MHVVTRRLYRNEANWVTRSIVEYATREQAQNAVATLSNQNLMGRLIYVREVRWERYFSLPELSVLCC